MTPCAKPARRAPRKPKPIARRTPLARGTARIRKASKRPAAVARRKADAEWRAAVKARACGRCECGWGTHIGTDAHHVFGKKAHPRLRHVISNGVWLSRACHNRAHRLLVRFRLWFEREFPERLAAINSGAA